MENFDTITLTQEELDFLKETFYVQAMEMTEKLTEEVLALESNGCKRESIKSIKRFFHTLKGDSSTIGLKEIAGVIHRTEDIICEVENKALKFDSGISDLILKVIDEINTSVKAHHDGTEREISKTLRNELDRAFGDLKKISLDGFSEYEEALALSLSEAGKALYSVKLLFAPDCGLKSAGAMIVAKHLPKAGDIVKLDPPVDSPAVDGSDFLTAIIATYKQPEEIKSLYSIPGIIGEVSVEPFDMDKERKATKTDVKPAAKNTKNTRHDKAEAQPIRVMSDKIDQVMDLVGELVMGRSIIEQLVKSLERRYPKDELVTSFLKANSFIGRSLTDLQRSVMSIRMVPIEKVFMKFHRMVRDLSKSGAKEINLILEGEDTEVDKALVDVVGEPLLHIIRNAVDHGIEYPLEREAAGKKRAGTIRVKAYDQDNDVIIKIEDDGRGIDPSKLREKAVQLGLIKDDEAVKIDDREALNLIFLPGFSTASAVSDVSGRGVGMDIVKEVVTGLRGAITVKSEVGKGTVFTLRFPMTLSIIRAILARMSGRLYALPMSSVVEITRAFTSDLTVVGGKEMLRIRDRVFPVIRMDGAGTGVHCKKSGKNGKIFVLILSHGDTQAGLIVDSLAGEKEMVVKAVDEKWVDSDMVGGASILGDGTVVLILNVASLIDRLSGGYNDIKYGKAAN